MVLYVSSFFRNISDITHQRPYGCVRWRRPSGPHLGPQDSPSSVSSVDGGGDDGSRCGRDGLGDGEGDGVGDGEIVCDCAQHGWLHEGDDSTSCCAISPAVKIKIKHMPMKNTTPIMIPRNSNNLITVATRFPNASIKLQNAPQ